MIDSVVEIGLVKHEEKVMPVVDVLVPDGGKVRQRWREGKHRLWFGYSDRVSVLSPLFRDFFPPLKNNYVVCVSQTDLTISVIYEH